MERSVPKRRHIHFRRHGIIQKKEYKQNKVLMYFKSDYMLRVHILTADKVRYKQISLTSFQTFQIICCVFLFLQQIKYDINKYL